MNIYRAEKSIGINIECLQTLSDVAVILADAQAAKAEGIEGFDSPTMTVAEFIEHFSQARAAALDQGFSNGDGEEAVARVFWTPVDDAWRPGFVWLQDDGATFVASPVPQSHV